MCELGVRIEYTNWVCKLDVRDKRTGGGGLNVPLYHSFFALQISAFIYMIYCNLIFLLDENDISCSESRPVVICSAFTAVNAPDPASIDIPC